jgi:autotransporter-associated beta strand protein
VGIASLLTGSAAHVARGEIITFQNGVNGYTGTFDRKIGLTTSNDRNGANVNTDTSSYFIDGGTTDVNDAGVIQGMIRFDNIIGPSAIPANALVISASLDMVTTTASNSQSNGAYTAYRMDTPFDASTTYASLGGDGIYNNVGRLGGSFNRPKISTVAAPVVTSARVDQIVQDWVNGSATNFGFGIRSDNNTDGWSPNTTGAATVANRPKLTVNYTTNPNARRVRYQQNVNGYNGTTDSFINGINGATQGAVVFGSSVEHGFLDGSNAAGANDSFDQPYLAKFDNIDLSMPAVTRADLVLHTGFDSDNSGTGGSFSIHRILKPWDLNTNYASLDSDGNASLTPVAELIANGFIAPAATETGQIGNAATLDLDVTSIVQAWKDGAPNYGFYIGSTGTADGWELYSSGAFGAVSNGVEIDDVAMQLAPELSILYVPLARLYWDIDGATAGAGGATPSGNWDGTAANFSADAAGSSASTSAATTADDDVIFAAGADSTGAYTVTVSGTQSAKSVQVARGSVTFTGGTIATPTFDVAAGATAVVASNAAGGGPTTSLTKTGAGTLTLAAANTYAGGTTVSAGTLVLGNADATAGGAIDIADGALAQAQAGLPKAVTVTTLATHTTGKFDLTNNSMVVRGMSAAQVQTLLAAGYNAGHWDGATGITSSAAAASTETSVGYASNASLNLTEFKGVTGLVAGDVLVKYTYAGDANLDGKVDIGDLGLLAGAWQQSGKVWFDGDFTYNGTVDIGDLGLLAGNWQKGVGSGQLLVSFDQAMAQFAAFNGVVVPEPASLSLLALGGLALLGRRRRVRQS